MSETSRGGNPATNYRKGNDEPRMDTNKHQYTDYRCSRIHQIDLTGSLLQNSDLHGPPKGTPPGNAGVPPASLCLMPLAGAELSSGAAGSQPVGGNLNGQTEGDPGRSSGSIRVAEMAKAVPDIVRAGRPRSRGGILHTINREHGLHPARESGEEPGSAQESPPP